MITSSASLLLAIGVPDLIFSGYIAIIFVVFICSFFHQGEKLICLPLELKPWHAAVWTGTDTPEEVTSLWERALLAWEHKHTACSCCMLVGRILFGRSCSVAVNKCLCFLWHALFILKCGALLSPALRKAGSCEWVLRRKETAEVLPRNMSVAIVFAVTSIPAVCGIPVSMCSSNRIAFHSRVSHCLLFFWVNSSS